MKRYFEHIRNTKAPHERRLHAMQISGVITAALFVVWAGTLGLRLATPADEQGADGSQTAAAAAAQAQNGPQLQVSTTSMYNQ